MTTIASSNVSAVTLTPDTSGNLIMTATTGYIDASGNTGVVNVPSGTTAQRPSSPVNGMIRYNTTTVKLETYANGAWANLTA